jgi:YD repeat-containing protein
MIMRVPTLIILFSTLFRPCYGQIYLVEKKYANHLEGDGLKGKVKVLELASDQWLTITTFNEFGNKIEEKYFSRDSVLQRWELHNYNQNQQVDTTYSDSRPFRKNQRAIFYKYDERGNKTSQIEVTGKRTDTTMVTTFKYDENNRLIEWRTRYFDSQDSSVKTYSYDQHNNILVKKERSFLRGQHIDRTFEHSYNSDTVSIRTLVYQNGELITDARKVSVYNGRKDEIFNVLYVGERKLTDYARDYSYDGKGNWIAAFEVDKKDRTVRFKTMETRKITYY